MRNDDVKPEYWLVKIAERSDWRADIQALTKQIYSVYAFDKNSYTYCCEITPSYELRWIAYDYEPLDDLTEEQQEELDNLMMSSPPSDPVAYFHVRVIRHKEEHDDTLFKKVDLDFDEDRFAWDQIAEEWGTGALMY